MGNFIFVKRIILTNIFSCSRDMSRHDHVGLVHSSRPRTVRAEITAARGILPWNSDLCKKTHIPQGLLLPTCPLGGLRQIYGQANARLWELLGRNCPCCCFTESIEHFFICRRLYVFRRFYPKSQVKLVLFWRELHFNLQLKDKILNDEIPPQNNQFQFFLHFFINCGRLDQSASELIEGNCNNGRNYFSVKDFRSISICKIMRMGSFWDLRDCKYLLSQFFEIEVYRQIRPVPFSEKEDKSVGMRDKKWHAWLHLEIGKQNVA